MSEALARRCVRSAEVEAAHDARLAPVDVVRLDRHVASCAQCQAQREALALIRREARGAARVDAAPLEARRTRASLLRAAAQSTVRPARTSQRLAVAAAVVVTIVAALVEGRTLLRGAAPEHTRAAPHPEARVDAVGDTLWSRSVDDSMERIHLVRGMLRVRVPHQHEGHRFLVFLPDGEVEVRGTQLLVEVREGRTLRLEVFEGLVALRLSGQPERLFATGARWEPPRESELRTAALPARMDADAGPRSARVVPRRSARALTSRPVTVDPMATYDVGLRAMERGDFGVASAAFLAFERANPSDERAEDAAYLRVLALRRSGSEGTARGAAEEYLQGYPRGARRWEVAMIAARAARAEGDCERARSVLTEFATRPQAAALVESCARRSTRPQKTSASVRPGDGPRWNE